MSSPLSRGEVMREAILDAIRRYQRTHGYPPSYQDIMERAGCSSKSQVAHHLMVLQRDGRVHMERGKMRTLKVL